MEHSVSKKVSFNDNTTATSKHNDDAQAVPVKISNFLKQQHSPRIATKMNIHNSKSTSKTSKPPAFP